MAPLANLWRILTEVNESSWAISVFLIDAASSMVLPLIHSATIPELAIVDLHPYVLNLPFVITPFLYLFIITLNK
jgi:hypothetical protein